MEMKLTVVKADAAKEPVQGSETAEDSYSSQAVQF
jgi:hypothetical protein